MASLSSRAAWRSRSGDVFYDFAVGHFAREQGIVEVLAEGDELLQVFHAHGLAAVLLIILGQAGFVEDAFQKFRRTLDAHALAPALDLES